MLGSASLPQEQRAGEALVELYSRPGNAVARRFTLIVETSSGFGSRVLPARITLLPDAFTWTHVKAILASRKTASIASGTVPPRSQWKPPSKSVPHFGSRSSRNSAESDPGLIFAPGKFARIRLEPGT